MLHSNLCRIHGVESILRCVLTCHHFPDYLGLECQGGRCHGEDVDGRETRETDVFCVRLVSIHVVEGSNNSYQLIIRRTGTKEQSLSAFYNKDKTIPKY